MTLTEEECAQKWTSLTESLNAIDNLIKDLVQTHQKSAEFENIEAAKLHQAAAFTMIELEKFKLRFTLTADELKDHAIQIEEDRVEKYQKKIQTDERPVENRPFRIDSDVAKRTINHFTD